MDAFSLLVGLTLAVVGLFLCRDYVRLQRSAYAVTGRVKSIQQVFIPTRKATKEQEQPSAGYVANGFYPVIEYCANGQTVSFTAIDLNTRGSFHVGDKLKIRVTNTRRQPGRVCRTLVVLVAMLSILGSGLIASALIADLQLSIAQIIFSSLVIAAGLAILALYARDQDENCINRPTGITGSDFQLYISEPTAFQKWQAAMKDPTQRTKIRSSQFLGATCMGSAMVMLVIALKPFVDLHL